MYEVDFVFQAEYVKKLRSQDPELWSVATLARLFNVKKIAIW